MILGYKSQISLDIHVKISQYLFHISSSIWVLLVSFCSFSAVYYGRKVVNPWCWEAATHYYTLYYTFQDITHRDIKISFEGEKSNTFSGHNGMSWNRITFRKSDWIKQTLHIVKYYVCQVSVNTCCKSA